jgi:hypothetical protein
VLAKLARRPVVERRDRKSDFPWFAQCLMATWIDTSWHFSYLDEMAWFMGGTIGIVLGGGDIIGDDQR